MMKKTKNILSVVFLTVLMTGVISCRPDNKTGSKNELTLSLAVPTFPEDNATCNPISLTLEWDASLVTLGGDGDISYDVYLGKSENSMTKIATISSESTTSYGLPQLTKDAVYYWQVVSSLEGVTAESNIFMFQTTGTSTASNQPNEPYSPVPADYNTTQSAGEITLTWECTDLDANDILTYTVYFDENPQPQTEFLTSQIRVAKPTVSSGKTYYWQVKVTDEAGNTNLSPVWRFDVQ